MPIASRLNHVLTISRLTLSGTANARGHRAKAYVDDPATVNGNLQERSSREVSTGELDGVAISDAIVFLPIAAATSSLQAPDRLKKAGVAYELVGLPRDAGGKGRHLEADLRRVTA